MGKYGGFKNLTVFIEVFPKHCYRCWYSQFSWGKQEMELTFLCLLNLGIHIIFTAILWERYYTLQFTDEKTVGHED